MITSAKYVGESNTIVFIEPDNINVPLDNQELVTWVSDGGIISPYVISLNFAKEIKIAECESYSRQLMHDSYSNPVSNITSDPDWYKEFVTLKLNAGLGTPNDNILANYQLDVFSYAVGVKAIINALSTSFSVISFNVEGEIWPVWNAPSP